MADEKVLGVVSGTRDGKLLVVTTPTRCDDPVADEVYMGLVSGTRNGKPLVAISTQRCGDTAGTLEVARGYLGLVSGTRDGKLLLAVPCGDCATGDPTVCDVTMCCELEGLVRVKIDNTPTWSSWTPANPICGGTSIGHWWWSCLNDEIEDDTFDYYINWTASEKDTLDAPEAYDTGLASGTRSCKTVIWSVEFDISGETYRLTYYVTEYHIFQTLPTVVTTDGCQSGWSLQRQDAVWNTIAGTELNEAYYNAGTLWMVNYEHDSPYGDAFCPEGYSNNGAEQWPSTGCFPLTDPCAEVDIIDPCNDDEDLV